MKKGRALLFLAVAVSFVLGFLPDRGANADDATVYCGMPAVVSPTANSTVSGNMTIDIEGDTTVTPDIPWTIVPGTTAQIKFKIVPAGTSLGDASLDTSADPLIHEWRFSADQEMKPVIDISGYANGNYTLGVHVTYECSNAYNRTTAYWPTYIDWQQIPITI